MQVYQLIYYALSYHNHYSIPHIYIVVENGHLKGTCRNINKLTKPSGVDMPKSTVIKIQDKKTCGHKVKKINQLSSNDRRHPHLGTCRSLIDLNQFSGLINVPVK